MLGKLCTECLYKYVRASELTCALTRSLLRKSAYISGYCLLSWSSPLDRRKYKEANYKDTWAIRASRRPDGSRFTSTGAAPTGLAGPRRLQSPPSGRDRSALSRQCVLRSERSGPGQVRDAPQRREGGTRRGGCGRVLWTVPAGLLRDLGAVQTRRSARPVTPQARAEAPAQAYRGGPCRAGAGGARGRTHARRCRVGRTPRRTLWHSCPPAQHPAASAPLSEAAEKKRLRSPKRLRSIPRST
ncbi:hypothetical protein ACVJGD_005406 [Bradyrhizobium sp. USDA 10063]